MAVAAGLFIIAGNDTTMSQSRDEVLRFVAVTSDGPKPRPAVSQTPLGIAEPPPPLGGPYEFVARQGAAGLPVTYDPCRPLRYVVNWRTAPTGGKALLADAIAQMESATGLRFQADGDTTEAPSEDRSAFQSERYGDQWAPILIAWTDPAEAPILDGEVAGFGGSTRIVSPDGPAMYVTGVVALDGPQLGSRQAQRGEASSRAVILHELAHLVGLDHVDDASQLMHPEVRQRGLQAGDLTGLARLGSGPCVDRL